MKYLIVVDVQNDFVDGVLGTAEARAMLPALLEKVRNFDGTVLLTKDTHTDDYLHTQEGKNLPVPHCIRGTDGWEFPPQLAALAKARRAAVYEKSCFGSTRLASDLAPHRMWNPWSWPVSAPTSAWCPTPCLSRQSCLKFPSPLTPAAVQA